MSAAPRTGATVSFCHAARDLLLFTPGINNGIPTDDLRKRKISHVKNAKPGQAIQINESRTGKTNTLYINREVYKAPREHL